MLCKLHTATVVGIEAIPVEVEVDVSGGLPGFHLVGLPNGAVREGAVRIRAALENSGFDIGSVKVTVNLAPADVRKDGAAFDLPIAIGILSSRRLLARHRRDLLLAGELSLDGRIKPIRGAISLARAARRQGLAGIVLPRDNAPEAAMVPNIQIHGVSSLQQAAALIAGTSEPSTTRPLSLTAPGTSLPPSSALDFAEVRGQPEARRAAEVAAAGGHNLLLIGPPGSGKTMIARRMGSILPPLTMEESIETTMIHSVAGLLCGRPLIGDRPFRAPHHTVSCSGLVGGGSNPRPGEVSLAHNGVLFLDELPEFRRSALEALRQPMEDGQVTLVRSRQVVTYPARFMLVAAMNPCPCGYRGSRIRACICGQREADRYRNRISGPLMDRFDLFVRMSPVDTTKLIVQTELAESSAAMAERVARARQQQRSRFNGSGALCNAVMSSRLLRRHVPLDRGLAKLLERYATHHAVSARAIHRACKVARTLADLEACEAVTDEHLLLALSMQQARWEP